MMVPAADFRECRLYPSVGLDQPRHLLQDTPQFASAVLRPIVGRVVATGERLDHLHGGEGIVAGVRGSWALMATARRGDVRSVGGTRARSTIHRLLHRACPIP